MISFPGVIVATHPRGISWLISPWIKWPPFRRRHFPRYFHEWQLCIWFEFHWIYFQRVVLTVIQHWFRECLGADKATSHFLNQCWSSPLTQICGARGRWVHPFILCCPDLDVNQLERLDCGTVLCSLTLRNRLGRANIHLKPSTA